jgi:hypothetical protein
MLREWQKRISNGVRRGGVIEGGFRTGEARFHLYRDGYWLRVSESLLEDFPLTARLLGTRGFEARMREFLPAERGYELELGETSESFADWLGKGAAPALLRAIELDLLAVQARRAPEAAVGKRLGLHPSAKFFESGERIYAFWRDEHGQVLRERISKSMLQMLERVRVPAASDELAMRLYGLGPDFSELQEMVAECCQAGLLVYQQ